MKKSISFDGWCEIQDELYLSNGYFNSLIKISKTSGDISVLGKFSMCSAFSRLLHHQPIKYKDKIIFVPNFSHGVHIYDLLTQEMSYIPVKKDEWKKFRCVDSLVWNGKLWMILSYYENSIVSMDLDSMEIDYYPNMYLPLKSVITNSNDGIVFWSLLAKQDYLLYGVLDNSGYIVKINIKDLKIEVIEVNKQKRFLDIAIFENRFYITQYSSKDIVIYDCEKKYSYIVNNKFDEMVSDDGVVYSNIIAVCGSIIIVSNNGEKIYSLNNDQIGFYGVLPEEITDIKTDIRAIWKRFYRYDIDESKIYLFPNRVNMMVTIDLISNTIVGKNYSICEEYMEELYQHEYVNAYIDECRNRNEACLECDMVDLKGFVNAIIT